MAGISAKDVKLVLSGKTILNNVSISLDSGKKSVLLGENGAGKTSLMRVLAGELVADRGKIGVDATMERVYVAQDLDEQQLICTVHDFIERYAAHFHPRVQRLWGLLDLDEPFDDQLTLGELSGGQRKIVQLLAAFADPERMLLLDEPENHLDYITRAWLIDRIKEHKGCVVLVSHDQFVIDQVANEIIELEDGDLRVYGGKYQGYLEEKIRQTEGRVRTWKEEERKIEQYRELVVRLRDQAKRNSDLSGTYRQKRRQLEKMRGQHGDKPRLERRRTALPIGKVERRTGKLMAAFRNVSITVGGCTLLTRVDQELRYGDRVLLFGRNGTGKTSLLRTLTGELEVSAGEVVLGPGVRTAYFSQEHNEQWDSQETPLEYIARHVSGQEQHLRSYLAGFLIGHDKVNRSVVTLSGGERARLRFAALLAEPSDLLLLDEPTNHLDRVTWEVLVGSLQKYNGTILIVSHDRTFADAVINGMWVIDEKGIDYYPGNLSEFLES